MPHIHISALSVLTIWLSWFVANTFVKLITMRFPNNIVSQAYLSVA